DYAGLEADHRKAFAMSLPPERRSILTEPVTFSFAGAPSDPVAPPPVTAPGTTSRTAEVSTEAQTRVFLVHGRDEAAKDTVTLFLERLGLEVIILHEQANGGRTLLSKFIEEASTVTFAVVLMTGDDRGRLATDTRVPPSPRARQNVVFELGFFIGLKGPAKVCALVAPDVEPPSDFEAVVYVPFGPQTRWRQDLARELKAAGMPINTDALLR
ncbi:MAG: TIR domain-containing protein, partial [Phenylobacterium sp.]